MPLNQPVNLSTARADREQNEITGPLYRMAEQVRDALASPEANEIEYVTRLGITLLHAAIDKEITLTDPVSKEQEVYRLWRIR